MFSNARQIYLRLFAKMMSYSGAEELITHFVKLSFSRRMDFAPIEVAAEESPSGADSSSLQGTSRCAKNI